MSKDIEKEENEIEEQQPEQDKSANAKEQAKAMQKLSGGADKEKDVEITRFAKAMSLLTESSVVAADAEKAKKLAAVTVKASDLDLLVKELELTREQADVLLRENNGDLAQALKTFVSA